ncbi:MAG: hypothetical protein HRT67_13970 [Flavobacteriaceae bacterium]|nr:hypothetical protein [Flavobacteriaceae bacterium]
MEEIYPIFKNAYGMSFQWKRDIKDNKFDKIQVIFRDTGFYLDTKEIKIFSDCISEAKGRGSCTCYDNECMSARNILLKTPSRKVDLAVNESELELIEELIKGTLFQIELDSFLNNICSN